VVLLVHNISVLPDNRRGFLFLQKDISKKAPTFREEMGGLPPCLNIVYTH